MGCKYFRWVDPAVSRSNSEVISGFLNRIHKLEENNRLLEENNQLWKEKMIAKKFVKY